MTISYAATAQGYTNLWARAVVTHVAQAREWAARIEAHESRYKTIEAATGVPWFFVALIHMRESSLDFNTYLGNGQSIHEITTIVPRGRGPWASFEDGAIDALKLEGLVGIKNWPMSFILWAAEKLNGFGYYAHGINSPYLWSWTNLYSGGKFSSDGVFDPNLVDPQPGVAAVLGELIATNTDVAAHFQTPQHTEPKPVTTTPAPAPSLSITTFLPVIEKLAPMLAMFLPPPWNAIATGVLELVQNVSASNTTVAASAIAAALQAANQHFTTTKQSALNPLGMGIMETTEKTNG